jgi:2'-hydroxyisoflavone reductase
MGAAAAACRAASGKDTECTWVSGSFLAAQGEQGDAGIPIWVAPAGEGAGMHRVSNARARKQGLVLRDPRRTVADLLAWWRALPETRTPKSRDRKLRAGLRPEREAEILAAWHAREKK